MNISTLSNPHSTQRSTNISEATRDPKWRQSNSCVVPRYLSAPPSARSGKFVLWPSLVRQDTKSRLLENTQISS
jgi:hypothetical protein